MYRLDGSRVLKKSVSMLIIAATALVAGLNIFAPGKAKAQGWSCGGGSTINSAHTATNGEPPCIPVSTGVTGGSGGTPGMQWESRWGAFAFDSQSATMGMAGAMTSRGRAKKEAIANCRSQGGTNCTVRFVFTNHCGAVSQGQVAGGRYVQNYYSDITLPRATEGALKKCTESGGANCEIAFTVCAKPQRI